jgi:hypothetical protein
MYPTAYTGFLHNSSTSYTQQVHDTVHKTSITLYTRSRPTCYTHQHAQRATITQFLRLHSTFSFRSLTCYVLFSRLVPCPPCFATFHIPRTAEPHLLKRLKTQFICIYIPFPPKIHPALSDICRNTYQLEFNHRRLLTEWLISKTCWKTPLPCCYSVYTISVSSSSPEISWEKKHSQSQVEFEERDTERRVGRRSG